MLNYMNVCFGEVMSPHCFLHDSLVCLTYLFLIFVSLSFPWLQVLTFLLLSQFTRFSSYLLFVVYFSPHLVIQLWCLNILGTNDEGMLMWCLLVWVWNFVLVRCCGHMVVFDYRAFLESFHCCCCSQCKPFHLLC